MEVQAPNIFGNFLAGRQAYQDEQQMAFRNQLAQRQAQMQEAEFQQQQEAIARQQQFNQLAAQYLGPNDVEMAGGLPQGGDPYAAAATAGIPGQAPQQGGPVPFSQLVALDPQRALQIRQAVAAEQEAARAKRVEQAKQGILQAQYVLQSQAPAKLLKVGFPEIAKQLADEGIDIDSLDDDTVRQYATNVIEALGPIAGVGPAGPSESPFAKINPSDYTPESVAAFERSGNFGDLQARVKPGDDPSDKKFQRANTLRDEFTALTKDYSTVRQAYDTIKTVSAQPSAAGDLSMVFAYMKLLDPNSSVRESEQASASNAAGVPDRVRNQWNRLLNGESLNPAQRADFVSQAANVLKARQTQFDKTRNKYKTLAKRAGVDPIDVVGEEEIIDTGTQDQVRSFASEAEAEAAGIKPGTKVIIGGVSGTWQ